MSEEHRELDVIGYLYGELDGKETKALRRAAEADPQLAEDLRSFERTRAIYSEDSLPEPPDVLSEAILRQEKILRAEPESWWTPLMRLFWHPAFGATAVVVVAVGAGLFYSVGEAPDAAAPIAATPVPSPRATTVVSGVEADQAAVPADAKPEPEWARPAEQMKMAKAVGKRDDGLAGLVERPTDPTSRAPGVKYPTAPVRAALDEVEDDSALSARRQRAGSTAGEARADKDAEDEGGALGRMANKIDSKGGGGRASAVAELNAAPSAAPGSPGQLTDPSILAQQPSLDSVAGSAGNVAAGNVAPPVTSSVTGGSFAANEPKPKPRVSKSSKAKRRPLPKKLQRRAGPTGEAQRELFDQQRMQTEDKALALLRAGKAAYDVGRYREALQNFQMAQQLDSRRSLAPASLIMEARAYRRLKQYQQAAEIFEQVLAYYPKHKTHTQVLDELVVCYEKLRKPALAQKARSRYAAEASKAAAKQADTPAALLEDHVEAEAAAEPAAVVK